VTVQIHYQSSSVQFAVNAVDLHAFLISIFGFISTWNFHFRSALLRRNSVLLVLARTRNNFFLLFYAFICGESAHVPIKAIFRRVAV